MCTVFTAHYDLGERIFDCLLAPMTGVQAEDFRASFLFMGVLIGHHQKWLGSTRTVMELQTLTSQLFPVAISWLSANPCTWWNTSPPDD